MDPFPQIAPNDLKALLALEPVQLIGAILRLNQVRYHNTLNAVVLASTLLELRRESVPADNPDLSE